MTRRFEFVEVGETVGICSCVSNKVYCLAVVKRLTKTMIVASGIKFYIGNGREVGGKSFLKVMTPKEITAWKKTRAKSAAEAEKRKHNPADRDDHVQAALRALRDKARCLCEKLQDEVKYNLTRDPVGAMMPHWWAEYLQMLVQIEASENVLKSGLPTTLKPSAEQSNFFK
jgi:hypothetical protein